MSITTEGNFYSPTKGIDVEGVREYASDQLATAHAKVWNRLSSLAASDTLKFALGYRSTEEQEEVTQDLEKIQEIGQQRANLWNQENYLTSKIFRTKIDEKALEYSKGHESEPVKNYWDALENRHDQALAVTLFFQDFANKVDSIREITDQDKELSSFYLAENIKKYGADLVKEQTREEIIASGKMSKEEIEAALRSGLIQYADVEPQFNKEGFKNDQEWNQAVYLTASRILEDRLIKQIKDTTNVDETKEIYLKAEEIWKQRIGQNPAPQAPTQTPPPSDPQPVEPEVIALGPAATPEPAPVKEPEPFTPESVAVLQQDPLFDQAVRATYRWFDSGYHWSGVTDEELALELGIDPDRASALLKGLIENNLVSQDENGNYRANYDRIDDYFKIERQMANAAEVAEEAAAEEEALQQSDADRSAGLRATPEPAPVKEPEPLTLELVAVLQQDPLFDQAIRVTDRWSGVTDEELASELGIDPDRASALLKRLIESNFVSQDENGNYRTNYERIDRYFIVKQQLARARAEAEEAEEEALREQAAREQAVIDRSRSRFPIPGGAAGFGQPAEIYSYTAPPASDVPGTRWSPPVESPRPEVQPEPQAGNIRSFLTNTNIGGVPLYSGDLKEGLAKAADNLSLGLGSKTLRGISGLRRWLQGSNDDNPTRKPLTPEELEKRYGPPTPRRRQ